MNNNMVPGHADAAGAGGLLSGCQVRAVTRAVTGSVFTSKMFWLADFNH